ncbi:MAG: hypothetical protein LBL24_02630 [Bacteroidales bacterium]|jgi:hypothetical protein|nr:hypothetical protein [Bacteroidales bacterium]
MAKVKINGQYAGGAWTAPYRVDITQLAKEGDNTVEVEVCNTWMNRLIGDQILPEKDRRVQSGNSHWRAESPLQPSGLYVFYQYVIPDGISSNDGTLPVRAFIAIEINAENIRQSP